MQTCAIVSRTSRGGHTHSVLEVKVFWAQMCSRSYEFRSAAVLKGSKTWGTGKLNYWKAKVGRHLAAL